MRVLSFVVDGDVGGGRIVFRTFCDFVCSDFRQSFGIAMYTSPVCTFINERLGCRK